MKTTLAAIRANGPCAEGWALLLKNLKAEPSDDREVSLLEILDSNGPWDCVWAFRAVDGFDREKRLTGCYMARCVLPLYEKRYPDDKRPRNAVETAERFAKGNATGKELAAAADAAWDAAGAAAWGTARDAAQAAARAAARAVTGAATRAVAWAAAYAATADRASTYATARDALETYLRALLTGAPLPEPYEFWKVQK